MKQKLFCYFSTFGLTVCFSFCAIACVGQTLQTITDRKDILIGEQIKLTIKATIPKQASIQNWVTIPDSVSHFEIVDRGKIDTVTFDDNSKSVEQTIIFTSFDSGKWVFPQLPIVVIPLSGQRPVKLATDSFSVNISYSPSDTSNQLRDIKPIIKIKVANYFWYYVAAATLLLLLIVYFLFRYAKRKRKVKPKSALSNLSAYDEAMKQIKELENHNLQEAASVKIYYSSIAAIYKNYLSKKTNIFLLNKTTGDLSIILKDIGLSTDKILTQVIALRRSDAVKFARYLPSSEENRISLMEIKEIIDKLESEFFLQPKIFN